MGVPMPPIVADIAIRVFVKQRCIVKIRVGCRGQCQNTGAPLKTDARWI